MDASDHSSRVAAALAENASRKRDSNGKNLSLYNETAKALQNTGTGIIIHNRDAKTRPATGSADFAYMLPCIRSRYKIQTASETKHSPRLQRNRAILQASSPINKSHGMDSVHSCEFGQKFGTLGLRPKRWSLNTPKRILHPTSLLKKIMDLKPIGCSATVHVHRGPAPHFSPEAHFQVFLIFANCSS
ncbi:hypothetical protein KIW84_022641 [Lathyrus oleraceus]|uniref:Uncharacterized protein n=1 Tax=Pisum sativum TaxID=3888 RepID=A0A9D4YGR9_PEA|nr:hypothetical protein KIW84_022641 [Pisum sativum]